MRAVICTDFAPLDRLSIEECPPPACGPDQVRIAVAAAGVNFVDALIVQGLYQVRPPLPFTPGGEVAGTIAEVGGGVEGWAVGERAFASVGTGGFASEACLDARRVQRTPDLLTDGQAATFLQSYLTAWFALHRRARAAAGQTLLVVGAGGGVGLAAVDVGAAMGLRVLAAASTEQKRANAAARGAAELIDSSAEDVKTRVRELTEGVGVDLIYDPIGGDGAVQVLRALAEDGQFLVIGFAGGGIPQLPANHILLLNRRVTGVDLGGWLSRHPDGQPGLLGEVLEAISSGSLHPIEPVAFALDDVVAALEAQQAGRIAGKAVLVP